MPVYRGQSSGIFSCRCSEFVARKTSSEGGRDQAFRETRDDRRFGIERRDSPHAAGCESECFRDGGPGGGGGEKGAGEISGSGSCGVYQENGVVSQKLVTERRQINLLRVPRPSFAVYAKEGGAFD